jgi:hypothetical protein
MVAAYFALVGFYFLLVNIQNWHYATVFLALGILSHSYVALYVPGAFLYVIFSMGKTSKTVKIFFSMLLLLLLVCSPYLIWSNLILESSSKFLLYPMMVRGYDFYLHSPDIKVLVINDFLSTSPVIIAKIRVMNMVNTLLPLFDGFDRQYIFRFWVDKLPGALTFFIAIFSYIGIVKFYKNYKKEILFFIISPFIFTSMYWGWFTGGFTLSTFQPLVPMMFLFGVAYILGQNINLMKIAVMDTIFEFIIFIVYIVVYIPQSRFGISYYSKVMQRLDIHTLWVSTSLFEHLILGIFSMGLIVLTFYRSTKAISQKKSLIFC